MPIKKQNILNKIVKKDYNNELEKILENKQFGENAKSTLLSILYKIEVSYNDIETVKKGIETKEEYIQNLFEIIQNKCDSIKIIKMNDEENNILENKTYIIDKDKKQIIAYPIERKILYAIAKIGKKDKIIKKEYFLINATLSDLINVGNNMNMVEPLRDFNGYSWTSLPQEVESIDHNLIYQNLRILVGDKFLNKWIKNNEFIIDYYELFKEELEKRYNKQNAEKVIELLSKISILLETKFNKEKENEFLDIKQKIELELSNMTENEKFIQNKTEEKVQITEKIKNIDTIVNNKELLEKEYKKRNEKLSLEKKIFSMRILSQIMVKERDEYFQKIEAINQIMNPINYVKYKKELEEKDKYLKLLDIENKDKEIDKLKIEFQKLFMKLLKIQIENVQTKQDIEKIIYDFRYYTLLPYNKEILIDNQEEIKKELESIGKLIIKKAIDLKAVERISKNDEENYTIIKNIFKVRIIKLENAYLKITKEKDKYFVQIFDENSFEEKINIQKPNDLEIKTNKKVLIMTH